MATQGFHYLCRHPNVFRVPTRDEPLLTHPFPPELLDPAEPQNLSETCAAYSCPPAPLSAGAPPRRASYASSYRVTGVAFHHTEDLFAVALRVTSPAASASAASSADRVSAGTAAAASSASVVLAAPGSSGLSAISSAETGDEHASTPRPEVSAANQQPTAFSAALRAEANPQGCVSPRGADVPTAEAAPEAPRAQEGGETLPERRQIESARRGEERRGIEAAAAEGEASCDEASAQTRDAEKWTEAEGGREPHSSDHREPPRTEGEGGGAEKQGRQPSAGERPRSPDRRQPQSVIADDFSVSVASHEDAEGDNELLHKAPLEEPPESQVSLRNNSPSPRSLCASLNSSRAASEPVSVPPDSGSLVSPCVTAPAPAVSDNLPPSSASYACASTAVAAAPDLGDASLSASQAPRAAGDSGAPDSSAPASSRSSFTVLVLCDSVTRSAITSWRLPCARRMAAAAAGAGGAAAPARGGSEARTREPIDASPHEPGGACHLAFTPDGGHLAVTDEAYESLFVFRLPVPCLLLHPPVGSRRGDCEGTRTGARPRGAPRDSARDEASVKLVAALRFESQRGEGSEEAEAGARESSPRHGSDNTPLHARIAWLFPFSGARQGRARSPIESAHAEPKANRDSRGSLPSSFQTSRALTAPPSERRSATPAPPPSQPAPAAERNGVSARAAEAGAQSALRIEDDGRSKQATTRENHSPGREGDAAAASPEDGLGEEAGSLFGDKPLIAGDRNEAIEGRSVGKQFGDPGAQGDNRGSENDEEAGEEDAATDAHELQRTRSRKRQREGDGAARPCRGAFLQVLWVQEAVNEGRDARHEAGNLQQGRRTEEVKRQDSQGPDDREGEGDLTDKHENSRRASGSWSCACCGHSSGTRRMHGAWREIDSLSEKPNERKKRRFDADRPGRPTSSPQPVDGEEPEDRRVFPQVGSSVPANVRIAKGASSHGFREEAAISPRSAVSQLSNAARPEPAFSPALSFATADDSSSCTSAALPSATVVVAAATPGEPPLLIAFCSRCGAIRPLGEARGRPVASSAGGGALEPRRAGSPPPSAEEAAASPPAGGAPGDGGGAAEALPAPQIENSHLSSVTSVIFVPPPSQSQPQPQSLTASPSCPSVASSGCSAGALSRLPSPPFQLLAWPALVARRVPGPAPLAVELRQNAAANRVAYRTLIHWMRALVSVRALIADAQGAAPSPAASPPTSPPVKKQATAASGKEAAHSEHDRTPLCASPSHKRKPASLAGTPKKAKGDKLLSEGSAGDRDRRDDDTADCEAQSGAHTKKIGARNLRLCSSREASFFRTLLAQAAAPVGLPSEQMVKEMMGTALYSWFARAFVVDFEKAFPLQARALRDPDMRIVAGDRPSPRGESAAMTQAEDSISSLRAVADLSHWWWSVAHTHDDFLHICDAHTGAVLTQIDLLMGGSGFASFATAPSDTGHDRLGHAETPRQPALSTSAQGDARCAASSSAASQQSAGRTEKTARRPPRKPSLTWTYQLQQTGSARGALSLDCKRVAVSQDRSCVAALTWAMDGLAVLELSVCELVAAPPSSGGAPAVSSPSREHPASSAAASWAWRASPGLPSPSASGGLYPHRPLSHAPEAALRDSERSQAESQAADASPQTHLDALGRGVRVRRQNWIPLFRGATLAFTDERIPSRQLVLAQSAKMGGRIFVLDWDSLFFQPSPSDPLPPAFARARLVHALLVAPPGSAKRSRQSAFESHSDANAAGARATKKKASRHATAEAKQRSAGRLAALAAHPATLAILETPERRGVKEVFTLPRHSAFCCMLEVCPSRHPAQAVAFSSPVSVSSSLASCSSLSRAALSLAAAEAPPATQGQQPRLSAVSPQGRKEDSPLLLFRVEGGQCGGVPVVSQYSIFQQLLSFHEKQELSGEDLDGTTSFFFRQFAREVSHVSWLKAEDAILRSRTHFRLTLPSPLALRPRGTRAASDAPSTAFRLLETDTARSQDTADSTPKVALLPICSPLLMAPQFTTPFTAPSADSGLPPSPSPSASSSAAWTRWRSRRACLRRWEHAVWTAADRRRSGQARDDAYPQHSCADFFPEAKDAHSDLRRPAEEAAPAPPADYDVTAPESPEECVGGGGSTARGQQGASDGRATDDKKASSSFDATTASLEELVDALWETQEVCTPQSDPGSVSAPALAPSSFRSASARPASQGRAGFYSADEGPATLEAGRVDAPAPRRATTGGEGGTASREGKLPRMRENAATVHRLGPAVLDQWLQQITSAELC
ncbi:hypothetical protein BESB_003110 [Besnoitia besnoiti]|uniref:Uncharacterized protein n=1 Tax=Besnoitia besnoiti TaxID=94643 RepID=A0A2A9MPY5_BESBE|nr:hypothetical protein BESB_003110 [Besnoitia besnoiti]PFH37970.1 hypothetical protein BESB_003110 [Besnoitia besnoiti]